MNHFLEGCNVHKPKITPRIPKWVEEAKTLTTEHFVHVSDFIKMYYDNPHMLIDNYNLLPSNCRKKSAVNTHVCEILLKLQDVIDFDSCMEIIIE